jgi:hypothetical protein
MPSLLIAEKIALHELREYKNKLESKLRKEDPLLNCIVSINASEIKVRRSPEIELKKNMEVNNSKFFVVVIIRYLQLSIPLYCCFLKLDICAIMYLK